MICAAVRIVCAGMYIDDARVYIVCAGMYIDDARMYIEDARMYIVCAGMYIDDARVCIVYTRMYIEDARMYIVGAFRGVCNTPLPPHHLMRLPIVYGRIAYARPATQIPFGRDTASHAGVNRIPHLTPTP